MKRTLARLRAMSLICYQILRGGLLVSSTLLFCSALLFWGSGPLSLGTYYLYRCAETMRDMAPVVMFIAVFGSAWCEERYLKSVGK